MSAPNTADEETAYAEVKAFVIVQIAINDRDGYHSYETAGHQEIFDKFSAKLVGVDEQVEAVEGSWPFTRTVIIESPSKELARPGMTPTNTRPWLVCATAPPHRTW